MTSTDRDTTAGTSVDAVEDQTEWRRLSARMLLVHPVQELFRALPALVVALVAGVRTGNGDTWSLLASGLLIVLGLVRWLTTYYRVTPARVELRRGIVFRQRTAIPRDRVRTVDTSSHALHRVLGLAKVTIGTGQSERGHEGMLHLDGLRTGEAARLHAELFPDDPESDEVELTQSRAAWLRFAPFNLAGPAVLVMLLLFLPSLDIDPLHTALALSILDGLGGPDPWPALAEAALLALAGSLVMGLCVSLFMFTNFRLARRPGGTLRITYGLITTRTTTLEERRVNGVTLSEHLVIRTLGGARATAIATGLRTGGSSSLLIPHAPTADALSVAEHVLRDPEPVIADLTRHGRRALTRRFTRVLWPLVLVAAVYGGLVWAGLAPAWPWPLFVAALPLLVLLAVDRYRGLGHALSGDYLVGRSGSLTRERWVLERKAVIGFSLRQSFFQRRSRLSTVVVSTPAGKRRYDIPDIDTAEAVGLARTAVPGLLEPYLA